MFNVLGVEVLEGGRMPTKSYPTDAGWDLYARCLEPFDIPRHNHRKVEVGIKLKIPPQHYVQILGRSGMACNGLFTHVGTVDQDFTGELVVILYNNRSVSQRIKPGDRVGQMILLPLLEYRLLQLESGFSAYGDASRGVNGYGSSGQ